MHNKKLTLTVTLQAKPEMANEVKEAALELIPLTRAEIGCIEYHFHINNEQPNLFLFYEVWRSEEDLEKHLQMPYLLEFKALLERALENPAEFAYWTKQD